MSDPHRTSRSKDQADELVARDRRFILRPWSDEALVIERAEGCIVTDVYGKDFIDFTSGFFVNNAGHCHPRITRGAAEQLGDVCQVSGKQSTIPLIDLAERLVQRAPPTIGKAFFTTGGSEANENALKMARQYSKKPDIAALDNGYHGLTLGALEACANQKYRETAGVPLPDRVVFVPNAYCYRCPHEQNCATQCLDRAEERLDARPETAALLAEPVQAIGGIIPPPAWWQRLDQMRRERGLLLILDEVQTGVGRTGTFFAAEHYGLEPDIMTAGKGLSGGVGSLAVVLAGEAVSADFFAGTTPTSAGNAVSAAAGNALIDTLEAEGMIDHCAAMGEYFTAAATRLHDPWIGDVRFKGLLGGIELVVDRTSKEILPQAQVLATRDILQKEGMLITISGPHGNVLRLQPPLCVAATHIDAFCDALKRALPKVRNQPSF